MPEMSWLLYPTSRRGGSCASEVAPLKMNVRSKGSPRLTVHLEGTY